jgi:hypothetical protein
VLLVVLLTFVSISIGYQWTKAYSPECEEVETSNVYLPQDYYRCFRTVARYENTLENQLENPNAMHVVEVWSEFDGRRNEDEDPCSLNNGEIGDQLIWFENGASNNFVEGREDDFAGREMTLKTDSPVILGLLIKNKGMGIAYGGYSNRIGAGRWSACLNDANVVEIAAWLGYGYIDENVLALVHLHIYEHLWLENTEGTYLHQPFNLRAYSRPNQVQLNWTRDFRDNGNGFIVHRTAVNLSTNEVYKTSKVSAITNYLDNEIPCGYKLTYRVASRGERDFSNEDDETKQKYQFFGLHSLWSKSINVYVNNSCNGGVDPDPNPQEPVPYTPTPTITPTPIVVSCGNMGAGAYLYNSYGSCFFVGAGETEALPFSPVRVELQGLQINVELCSTTNGTNPCSQVNKSTSDLSWSSIFGRFRSAKVSDGFASNCGGEFTIHEVRVYSEKPYKGACYMLTPGRYSLPFSPKSVRFGSGFLELELCESHDATNPCDEYHDSDDDLSESSSYGSFRSGLVNYEEPHYGDLQIQLVGLSEGNSKFTFRVHNENGSGFTPIQVQLIENPDTSILKQKQYVYLSNWEYNYAVYSVNVNTNCFHFSVDPDGLTGEEGIVSNNFALWCKDGSHQNMPAPDAWLPELSILKGQAYVFDQNQKLLVKPNGQQIIVVEGHRPSGWIATGYTEVLDFDEANRVDAINEMFSCDCVRTEVRIKENGTVQRINHTTPLATPTVTPTPTATNTRTPRQTPTSTMVPTPTSTLYQLPPTPTPVILIGDLKVTQWGVSNGGDHYIAVAEIVNEGGIGTILVDLALVEIRNGASTITHTKQTGLLNSQPNQVLFEEVIDPTNLTIYIDTSNKYAEIDESNNGVFLTNNFQTPMPTSTPVPDPPVKPTVTPTPTVTIPIGDLNNHIYLPIITR